MEKISDNE